MTTNEEEITTPETPDKEKIDDSPSTKDESNMSDSNSSFHLLEGRWTFWYTHRPTTFRNSSVNYDSCLKKLGLHSSARISLSKNSGFNFF